MPTATQFLGFSSGGSAVAFARPRAYLPKGTDGWVIDKALNINGVKLTSLTVITTEFGTTSVYETDTATPTDADLIHRATTFADNAVGVSLPRGEIPAGRGIYKTGNCEVTASYEIL